MRFSIRSLLVTVAIAANAFWIYRTAYPLGGVLIWIFLWTVVCLAVLRIKYRWPAVAAGLMILMGLVLIPVIAINGHSVPLRSLEQIRTGNSAPQVKALLGSPKSIACNANGSRWKYVGPSWCHVNVQFDWEDKVMYVTHDH